MAPKSINKYSWQGHWRIDHSRMTLSWYMLGLPNQWRAINLTLWDWGKVWPTRGNSEQKDSSQAAVTEIGKSILVPNPRALDYWGGPFFIYGDRFSFLLIKPLQSLHQRTVLSGEEIFPSLCPWFWLKLNCSGTLSFGSRLKHSFLQLKLSPYKPSWWIHK